MTTRYYNFADKLVAQSTSWSETFTTTGPGQTLTGDSANDYLADPYGGGTLIGGTGSDTFSIVSSNEQVIVTATNVVDTVLAWANFAAPTNVNNLDLKKTGITGIANAAGDLIIASGTDDTLVGGAGSDTLVDAGAGGDYFSIGAGGGDDVIYGFQTSGATHDYIQLTSGIFTSFSQIQSHLTQDGSDVLLTLSPTQAVLIRGTTVSALTASDFAFNINLGSALPVFDDEFNSLSLYDASTGTGVWKTNFGSGAQSGALAYTSRTLVSGGEQELYVDPSFTGTGTTPLGLDPFSINSSGGLVITGSKASTQDLSALSGYKYVSGLLTTQTSFAQLYGYFEIRAELPAGQGVWPGFWLLPTNGAWPPEADVVEQVGGPVIYNTAHYDNSAGTTVQTVFQSYLPGDTTGFHTYGMLWTASTLSWYVDGVEVASMATPADMHTPMYMLINLALGGNFPGDVPSSFTSAQMEVDWVRAYTLQDLGLASGTDSAIHIVGGSGDNTYYVHNSADTISVAAGTPNESVVSVVSYALPANIQSLTVDGSGLIATGNSLNDTLTSEGGANKLVGGSGVDTFYVNNASDVVVEPTSQPGDVIIASVDYGLTGDQHVLRLSGANLTGTANAAGGSYITALGASDTLVGSAAGGDTFTIFASNDIVQVAAGTPGDVVVAYSSYTLPANVNALTAGGGGDYTLTGNGANDVLTAGKGADILTGGGGNVTFVVAPGDRLETITDFDTHGAHDQIDVSAYQAAGVSWYLVQHGTATWIDFTNGDITEVQGVTPGSLTLSGHDLI